MRNEGDMPAKPSLIHPIPIPIPISILILDTSSPISSSPILLAPHCLGCIPVGPWPVQPKGPFISLTFRSRHQLNSHLQLSFPIHQGIASHRIASHEIRIAVKLSFPCEPPIAAVKPRLARQDPPQRGEISGTEQGKEQEQPHFPLLAMIPRSVLRVRTILAAVFLTSFLVWSFSRYTSVSNLDFTLAGYGKGAPDLTPAHQSFWRSFHSLLEEYGPDTTPLVEDVEAPTEGFKAKDAGPRPDYVLVAGEDVGTMKEAHAGFLNALKSSFLHPQYIPGTRGVVSTAGGPYLPVLVISLRMLRRTGSRLPVEVFLADDNEYEEYICDVVLPSLDARCIILSRILEAAPAQIEKYQFKPFAMLFSSFEEILFLDADAFPLEKPEHIFKSDVFRSMNMISWPDFWASSVSPTFYEIAGIPAPPMDLRQSTESGEFFISKKTHSNTLLLATYYNYWGPSHYWPLLSQGAAGEGDKETFLAAAMAVNEPFYQVSESICALGHRTEGGMAGSAMAQFNPIQDYALTSRGKWRVRGDKAPAPDVFFIHANFPKFNPATVFEGHEVNPTFSDDGSYTRAWTIPDEVIDKFNAKVDVEKAFWKEILWTACELESKFVSWEEYVGICDGVKDYWRNVFEWHELPS